MKYANQEGWPELITPEVAKLLIRLMIYGPEEIDRVLGEAGS